MPVAAIVIVGVEGDDDGAGDDGVATDGVGDVGVVEDPPEQAVIARAANRK